MENEEQGLDMLRFGADGRVWCACPTFRKSQRGFCMHVALAKRRLSGACPRNDGHRSLIARLSILDAL